MTFPELAVDSKLEHELAEGLEGQRPSWAVLDATATFRYLLGRRYAPGGRTLAWVMLNPSTADAALDDQTIRQVGHYTRAAGYAQAVVANLFAYRSVDPRELERAGDPVGPANYAALRSLAGLDLVVAWGANVARGRLQRGAKRGMAVLAEAERLAGPYCLGTTAAGHPRHPARLGHALELKPWLDPWAR